MFDPTFSPCSGQCSWLPTGKRRCPHIERWFLTPLAAGRNGSPYIRQLAGRVLGHGEDEAGKDFGRHYLLLEGIDAKIHLIYHTPELEAPRSRGQLGANSFIELPKRLEMAGGC
jgi:hypothetical protein